MSVIENSVVQMQFNNQDFERNVKTTMSSLDRLKAALKFDKSASGLDSINKSVQQVSFSPMENGIVKVQASFSALQVMAITALQNITNKITDTASNLVHSFVIEPVSSGFQEYEMTMDSVQTIMASTGESLETVMGYLNELNIYADKTIYSFADMKASIGKFTNAGVDLDTAVRAIQGISNEAAVSGANAQEASRAMYNFAQALSSGAVKLIDWKSIENANMATVEFKTKLLDAAVAMGTAEKAADGMYKILTPNGQGSFLDETISATHGFNDSLAYMWMTTDVLTGTLAEYADEETEIGKKAYAAAQDVKTFSQMMDTLKEAAGSGWVETWQAIIGNYDEAKVLFTDLSNVFGGMIDASSNARNSVIKEVFGQSKTIVEFEQKIKDAGVSLDAFYQTAFEHAKSDGMFGKDIESLEDLKAKYGSLEESLGHGWLSRETTVKAVDDLIKTNSELAKAEGLSGEEAEIMTSRLTSLKEAAEDGSISFHQLKLAAQTPTGRELFVDSLYNILGVNRDSGLTGALKRIKKAWHDVFGDFDTRGIRKLLVDFNSLTAVLTFNVHSGNAFYSVFKGIFSLLKIGTNIITGPFKAAFRLLHELTFTAGDSIDSLIAPIAELVTWISTWFDTTDIWYSVLKGIAYAIGAVVYSLQYLIDKIASNQQVQAIWNSLLNGVTVFVANFNKYMGDAKDTFLEFIQTIKTMHDNGTLTFDNLLKVLGDFKDRVVEWAKQVLEPFTGQDGVIPKMREFFVALAGEFREKLEQAIPIFQKAREGIGGFFSSVAEFAGKLDYGAIAAVISALLGLKGLLKLSEALNKLDGLDFVGFLNDTMDNIVKMEKSLNWLIKSKSLDIAATGVLKLAVGIGIMAAAVYLLSTISDPKKLWIAVGALSALVIVLTGAAFAISKAFEGLKGLEASVSVSMTISGLALAILILVGAMKLLTTIDSDQMMGCLAVLTLLGIGLIGFTYALKTIKPQDLIGAATYLIGFGLALIMIVRALGGIAGLDMTNIRKNMNQLAVVLAAMMGMMYLSKFASKEAKQVGVAVLLMSVSIMIMIHAIKSITKIKPSDLAKGMLIVTSMLVIFMGIMKLSKDVGEGSSKAGFTMVGFAASIAIMALAIKALAAIKLKDLIKGVAAIGALTLFMVQMTSVKDIAGGDSYKSIIAMSAGILIMSASLAVLSFIPFEKLIKSVAALSTVMFMFCAMLRSSAFTTENLGPLIALTASIVLIAGVLALLAQIPSENLLPVAVSIAAVMGAISVTMVATGKASVDYKKVIVNLGAMIVAVGLIGLVLAGVSKLGDPSTMLQSAISISTLLLALSASLVLIGISNASPEKTITALQSMAIVMLGVAAFIGTIIALDELIPGLGEFMHKGLNILVELGEKLGEAIGSLISGFALGATSQLPSIGQNLSDFASSSKVFFDTMSGVDTKAVTAFVEMMLALTASNFLNGISGLLGFGDQMDLTAFAKQIAGMAPWLAQYAVKVKDLDTKAVKNSATACKVLAEFASEIPNTGGKLANWVGDNTISDFVEQLPDLGEKLVAFSESVSGKVDAGAVKSAANSAKIIASFAADIPNEGGFLGMLLGDNDISKFASHLKDLGDGIVGFSEEVSGNVDADAVNAATNSAKLITEFANNIPNEGGWLSKITGDNSLLTFAEELPDFGEKLADFSGKISGNVHPEEIDKITGSVSAIVTMAQTLDTSVFGNTVIDDFADDIDELGKILVVYDSRISDVNNGAIEETMLTLQSMASTFKVIAVVPTISQFIKNTEDLSKMDLSGVDMSGTATSIMNSLSSSISASSGGINNAISGVVGGGTSAVTSQNGSYGQAGKDLMSSMAKGMSDSGATIKTAMSVALGSAKVAITEASNSFKSYGSDVVSKVSTGVYNAKSSLSSALGKVVSDAKYTISTYYWQFEQIGKYLVDGLKSGITSKAYEVGKAAAKLVTDTIDKANEAGGIQSPSRETMKTGRYLAEGMAIGLNKYADKVYTAGTDIANGTMAAMSLDASSLTAAFDENAKTPVIRPVLDLDDVRAGASSINGIFGNTSIGVGLNTNVGAISAMMQSRQNGATNDDVVQAIRTLGRSINELDRNVYNVGDVSYGSDTEIANAVGTLARAIRVERRV